MEWELYFDLYGTHEIPVPMGDVHYSETKEAGTSHRI